MFYCLQEGLTNGSSHNGMKAVGGKQCLVPIFDIKATVVEEAEWSVCQGGQTIHPPGKRDNEDDSCVQLSDPKKPI